MTAQMREGGREITNVVVMPVTDTEDVCCDTVPSAAQGKPLAGGLIEGLVLVVLLEPVCYRGLLERRCCAARDFCDFCRRCGVADDFDEPGARACTQSAVRGHLQVEPLRLPHLVHEADHLERETVLAEVVALLEDEMERLAARLRVLEDEIQRELARVLVAALLHAYPAHMELLIQGQDKAGRDRSLCETLLEMRLSLAVAHGLNLVRDEPESADELLLVDKIDPLLVAAAEEGLQQERRADP